jgi:phage major head subunit gpT-like protein
MDLTSPNLQALFTGFHVIFDQGYAQPEPWWSKLAELVPSQSELELYGWMASDDRLKEWIGPRTIRNVMTRDRTIRNRLFELTKRIPSDKIRDDSYGVYAGVPRTMGYAAAKWPDDLALAALQGNATGFDAVAFFSGAHPVSIDNAGYGTQSNDFALALTHANYGTVRSNMQQTKADNNRVLGVMPDTLIVPPQLEDVGRSILESEMIAGSTFAGATNVGAVTNIYRGSAKLVVIPELANQATTWYLACTQRPIKPMIFQQRQAPQFVYKNQPTDDNEFWNREFIYGVDARGEVALTLWFLMARSVG